MTLTAVYRNGKLELDQPVDWAEGDLCRVTHLDRNAPSLSGEMEWKISDPDDETPMTAEEIDAWKADMDSVSQYRMTDAEYEAYKAERLRTKREQIILQAKRDKMIEELFPENSSYTPSDL